MDHVQRCSVLSVFSCSKHLVPKVKFHGLARHAATKTVPEGTCARRRRGRGERVLGGSPFPLLLRALRVLCAKKILAIMRDSDGLQCSERGEKVLPKMQTSPTLQCKDAKKISVQATKRSSFARQPFPPPTFAPLGLCVFALNPNGPTGGNRRAQRRRGRGERVLGGLSFVLFLCALCVLCANKIFANMREADGLRYKGGLRQARPIWAGN
jgi:hypothetical protein